MKTQNYNNHKRYYLPHHLGFYVPALILLLASLYYLFKRDQNFMIWLVISGMILLMTGLALLLRQHYSLSNQNRIIRMELRFRYYVLTHQRFEMIEERLSESQVLALRFAPDEELPQLVERTLKENLSADMIKRSVKNWLPDHHRV
ncbi:MAG: DUF6526 family protein [Bacteroidota bacterium]